MAVHSNQNCLESILNARLGLQSPEQHSTQNLCQVVLFALTIQSRLLVFTSQAPESGQDLDFVCI